MEPSFFCPPIAALVAYAMGDAKWHCCCTTKEQNPTSTDLVLLPDTVRPVLGLELQRRVPVDVVQDHPRGRVQVQALAAGCSLADDIKRRTKKGVTVSDMHCLS